MKLNFPACLALTLAYEGGYVNNPKDPGGATNKGITIGTLRNLGIDVDGDGDSDVIDLKAIRPADVEYVYRSFYWNPVQGDMLPKGLDHAVFDASVMSGVMRASQWLQRAVGVDDDGSIGPVSIRAVQSKNDIIGLIHSVCDQRLAFCKVAKNRQTGALLWTTFGKGWTSRIEQARNAALKMA